MAVKNENLSLDVKINGRNRQDLIDALEVILSEIDGGHILGFNANYTGDYFYSVQTEQEKIEAVAENLAAAA